MPSPDREKRLQGTRDHYAANSDVYKARAKAHTALARVRNRTWLIEYLRSHPCVDCGESDPVVLEFDHRDGTDKTREVGIMANNGCSIAKLEAETEKCDVRCANCHRRRTHKQRGWWGSKLEE